MHQGKNYSCIYLIYILFCEKFSECFHCTGFCNWEVVYLLGKESCYWKSDESVNCAYRYDDETAFPNLIPCRVLNDLNHAKHQKWQGLLGTEFFQLFPSGNVMSHQWLVDLCVKVYDKLCHNNQDENEQGHCTFDQVTFRGKDLERCLSIPTFSFAFIIFSLRCFSKDRLESSMRPKCFCSFTLSTTITLNIT